MRILLFELIVIIFLSRRNGHLAVKKGLKFWKWGLLTTASWLVMEAIGFIISVSLFGTNNAVGIYFMSVGSAFGGYLIIRSILEKKPDYIEKNIEQIGVDDLKPPVN